LTNQNFNYTSFKGNNDSASISGDIGGTRLSET